MYHGISPGGKQHQCTWNGAVGVRRHTVPLTPWLVFPVSSSSSAAVMTHFWVLGRMNSGSGSPVWVRDCNC